MAGLQDAQGCQGERQMDPTEMDLLPVRIPAASSALDSRDRDDSFGARCRGNCQESHDTHFFRAFSSGWKDFVEISQLLL
jgi:hypothetical protein